MPKNSPPSHLAPPPFSNPGYAPDIPRTEKKKKYSSIVINKDLRIGNEPGPLTPYPKTCSKGPHFLNENDFRPCY